ncbi:DUF1064 domain-containing protein [Clostridium estertheticum]|uniref:DUF1064 domain-containing protein n=1 Tax=Clostridium estertheticum TaxID=238834 RepID=UPI001CF21216|nr:DUF1064 domain-containing protein [Clostridium estertheticum]MCB2359434.1 DUF1064 domain-containing protein [Clostridium estertheticum]
MSKYNAQKCNCDGYSFDSKDEMGYYEYLKTLRSKEMILNFELQPKYTLLEKFKYMGKSRQAMTYTPDFLIYHIDGTRELIDVKGMETQQGNMRRKLFEHKYQDLKLVWIASNYKYGDINGWITCEELKKKRAAAAKLKKAMK